MRRTTINLFMEAAPVDPFDEDGPEQFQVVAVDRAEGTVWALTDRHTERERAMDQLRRSIQASATRYELDMVDRHITAQLAMLSRRVTALFGWCQLVRATIDNLAEGINANGRKGNWIVKTDTLPSLRDPKDEPQYDLTVETTVRPINEAEPDRRG